MKLYLILNHFREPGIENWVENSLTALASAATSASAAKAAIKSTNFLPTWVWMRFEIWTDLTHHSATLTISLSVKPLVVSAGVPSLMPPGFTGLKLIKLIFSYEESPIREFLLTVMLIASSVFSTFEPVRSWGLKSHMIKWVSVPPVLIFSPLSIKAAQRARAF